MHRLLNVVGFNIFSHGQPHLEQCVTARNKNKLNQPDGKGLPCEIDTTHNHTNITKTNKTSK